MFRRIFLSLICMLSMVEAAALRRLVDSISSSTFSVGVRMFSVSHAPVRRSIIAARLMPREEQIQRAIELLNEGESVEALLRVFPSVSRSVLRQEKEAIIRRNIRVVEFFLDSIEEADKPGK